MKKSTVIALGALVSLPAGISALRRHRHSISHRPVWGTLQPAFVQENVSLHKGMDKPDYHKELRYDIHGNPFHVNKNIPSPFG